MRELDIVSVNKVIEDDSEKIFQIDIVDDVVYDLCLRLNLLYFGLISSLKIGRETIIEVGYDPLLLNSYGVSGSGENSISVRLSKDMIEYVITFFLTYVRDGISAVDHIDLELNAEGFNKAVFITFKVSKFLPPVSPEEVRNKLGLKQRRKS